MEWFLKPLKLKKINVIASEIISRNAKENGFKNQSKEEGFFVKPNSLHFSEKV